MNPKSFIIFDRSVYDTYAYASLQNISKEAIYIPHSFRYRAVFLFERLPIVFDEVRRDTEEQVKAQEKALIEVYESEGYQLQIVPRFSKDKDISIEKRVQFIKNAIQDGLVA